MALPGIKQKKLDMQNNHGSIPRHEQFTGTSQKPKDKKSQHPGGGGPAATPAVHIASDVPDHRTPRYDLGLATQAPSILLGPISNDKPFEQALDGHAGSQVSFHTDGQFALAPASTASQSLLANLQSSTGGNMLLTSLGLAPTAVMADGSSQAQTDARHHLSGLIRAMVYADSMPPTQHLAQEAVIREAQDTPVRMAKGNLLTLELSVPQLSGVGLGALALTSLLM